MSIKYYWKECFGVCLEGSVAKHWLIRNNDGCESVIADVVCNCEGLWRGYVFYDATRECESLIEAQQLTLSLVKAVGLSMSKMRVGKE